MMNHKTKVGDWQLSTIKVDSDSGAHYETMAFHYKHPEIQEELETYSNWWRAWYGHKFWEKELTRYLIKKNFLID